MKKETLFLVVLVGGLGLGLGAHSLIGQVAKRAAAPTDDMKSAAQTINIDNFAFSPATVTVPAGTKITWTNHDDIPHNIMDTAHGIKSKALDTDDSFSYTFGEPGTYDYFCSLHPKMVGKIVVEAKK